MQLPEDELVHEACCVIEAGYRSVQDGSSGNVADLVTIAQGYLRLLSQQPTPVGETRLREALTKLRTALVTVKSAPDAD